MAAGRPRRYDADIHPAWAWSLSAVEGLTEVEIADKMGIARATLSNWKNKYEDFAEALRSGKEPTDAKVEKTLLDRAVGYTVKERKIINTIGKDGKPQPAKIETTEKHIPADVTAMIFWLKNRNRAKWRDKWDVEVDNDKEITFNIIGASQKKEEKE